MLSAKNSRMTIILFLLPAIILYLVFMIYPTLQEFYLSFFKWSGVGGSVFKFYGIHNYLDIFNDRVFWLSVKNLAYFLILSLITQLPLAFLLAYLLSLGLKGTRFFKLTFFMPVVLSATAVSMMWKVILAPDYGLLNGIINAVGLTSWAKPWLSDPSTAFTSIILVNSWLQIGYFVVILLAAILSIPQDIFEALKLDGASHRVLLFQIILPLTRDVFGVCVVLIITTTMKTFDIIYVMTSGTFGPADINQVPVGYMYYSAFVDDNFGNGSAIAVLVMLSGIIISSTLYLKVFMKNED